MRFEGGSQQDSISLRSFSGHLSTSCGIANLSCAIVRWKMIWNSLRPSQGRFPETSSQRITPRLNTSDLVVMPPSLALKHSGALQTHDRELRLLDHSILTRMQKFCETDPGRSTATASRMGDLCCETEGRSTSAV